MRILTKVSIENYIYNSRHRTSLDEMKNRGKNHNWVLKIGEIQANEDQWGSILEEI